MEPDNDKIYKKKLRVVNSSRKKPQNNAALALLDFRAF